MKLAEDIESLYKCDPMYEASARIVSRFEMLSRAELWDVGGAVYVGRIAIFPDGHKHFISWAVDFHMKKKSPKQMLSVNMKASQITKLKSFLRLHLFKFPSTLFIYSLFIYSYKRSK